MNVPVILRRRRFQYGGGVVPFSPSTLFASGEEGAWYEPSTTTAFTATATGTNGFTDIAPAGYGDLCAILLDKSQGAGYSGGSFTGLGSELVTNGTFDSNITGWTNGLTASSSWSSGEIFVTGGAQFGVYQQLSGLTVGTTYYLSADGRVGTGSDVRVRITSDTDLTTTRAESNVVTATGSNEQMSLTFVAQETNPVVYLRTSGNGDTGYFDNISVRELPGNHATQSSEPARPILARVPSGGRRNLAIQTQDFSATYGWAQRAGTVSHLANQADGPFGDVLAADKITGTAGTTWVWALPQTGEFAYATSTGVTYTFSVYVKSATGSNQTFRLAIDPSTALSSDFTATSEWQRFSFSSTSDGTPTIGFFRDTSNNGAELYVSDWQIEVSSSATAYQKVVDQYDITEAGVTSLEYLAFDGSDDGMATAAIDFTATDEMSMFVGVLRNNADGIAATIVELSSNSATNNQNFALFGPTGSTSIDYLFRSKGSADSVASVDGYSSTKNVVSGLGKISTDTCILRIDGTQVASSAANQGVGNFGNYPLNIGARDALGADSVWLDGRIFSLIVRGAASTAQEISDTESYVANLSGVTLP